MFNLTPWKKKSAQGGALTPTKTPTPLAEIRNEMESMFDRLWRSWPASGEDWLQANQSWGLEVLDEDREIVIRAETPGFRPEDIDVQLSGSRLMIRAEHKEESNENGSRSYHHGTYQRVIPIPDGVEEEKIDAKYDNGVLEIHLPKGEVAMTKRIAVKAG